MNNDDIEKYLRAKNKWSLSNILMYISIIFVVAALFVSSNPNLSQYTFSLLLGALIMASSTYGIHARAYVSRKELLNIIERQINNDPQALKYISDKMYRKK